MATVRVHALLREPWWSCAALMSVEGRTRDGGGGATGGRGRNRSVSRRQVLLLRLRLCKQRTQVRREMLSAEARERSNNRCLSAESLATCTLTQERIREMQQRVLTFWREERLQAGWPACQGRLGHVEPPINTAAQENGLPLHHEVEDVAVERSHVLSPRPRRQTALPDIHASACCSWWQLFRSPGLSVPRVHQFSWLSVVHVITTPGWS